MEQLTETSTTDFFLIKHRFYSTVIADILKAIQGGSFGGAFILSFCCIDYMSVAMQPNKDKNTNEDFKSFIRTYLTPINDKYSSYENELYAFRCSLVHTYGQSDATKKLNIIPQFGYNLPPFEDHLHFSPAKNKLTLNLSNFVSELICAVELFFKSSEDNIDNLKVWANKLYYPQGLGELLERKLIRENKAIKHENIHPYLATFDKELNMINNCADLKEKIENDMIKHL